MNQVTVIVVAAGAGKRFGSTKQFALLRGKPVLDWSMEEFEAHEKVSEIVLVLADECKKENFTGRYGKLVSIVRGGEKRQDSVVNGFKEVKPEKADLVLIHDAARPIIGPELITRVIEEGRRTGAAVPVIPMEDTIKEAAEGRIIRTLNRESLVRVQTPQGFAYSILEEALKKAQEDRYYATDEAMLVERTGRTVSIVKGDPRNIKITTPLDLRIAEALLGS